MVADQEFGRVVSWTKQLEFPAHVGILIEACRVLDLHHVLQVFSKKPENKLPIPDFDIMVRGWNAALGLLLPHARGLHGIPLMESTDESRAAAMTFLDQLGRSSLLKQTADMIRHGMVDGEFIGDHISLKMSDRTSLDHFLDRVDSDLLRDLSEKMGWSDPAQSYLDENRIDDLEARLAQLVFPWSTNRGTMVGYHAEPDIDQHFLALVMKETLDWRNEAGIHPDAKLKGVSGDSLVQVGLLLTSFYFKHIRLVDVGKQKMPEVNYAMSLTIWQPESKLRESISDFTGMALEEVSAVLDLFTVSPDQHGYFLTESTPFIPMLIKISDEHVLSPVSSIFRNPLRGLRMLHGQLTNQLENSVREPREEWMTSELVHLFLGTRYRIVDKPTRLKRENNSVTDIDAAIVDITTGELALFQLKWQDFDTNEIKSQRSKAKNFVNQTDDWARNIKNWIAEYGTEALGKSLQLTKRVYEQITAVRLFGIGRSASRFQSYGYAPTCSDLALCSWPQFVRLRYEVGPATNVFKSLHEKIQAESTRRINKEPLRHELNVAGQIIVFQDLWNLYDEQKERLVISPEFEAEP